MQELELLRQANNELYAEAAALRAQIASAAPSKPKVLPPDLAAKLSAPLPPEAVL